MKIDGDGGDRENRQTGDRRLKLIDAFEAESKLPVSRRAIALGVLGVSSATALVWGLIENQREQDRIDDEAGPSVRPGPAAVREPGMLAGPSARPVWQVKLPAVAHRIAVGTGVLVVEDKEGRLRGFEAQSGAAKWTSSVKLYPAASPIAALGDVFLGLTAGHLQAVGALDGKLRWQTGFGDDVHADPVLLAAVLGSTVLVTGETYDKGDGPAAGTIWAVDTATQTIAWTAGRVGNHSVAETLAVSQSAGVVLSADLMSPGLIAYSLSDHQELWRKSPDDDAVLDFPLNCVAAAGNTFYWAEYQLHALDAVSGRESWVASASGLDDQFRAVVVVPGAAPDGGDLVVATVTGQKEGGALYAFAAKSGAQVWRQESGKGFGVNTALSTMNGIVFAAEADNGSVFAVDAKSGETRWTFHDPAIADDLEWVTAVDGVRLYVAYGKALLAFEP